MAPTSPQVGSQVGAKMDKKSIQKSIKKLMALGLGSVFGRILVDFGRENEGKLAPKWDQKSMLTSKGRICKNTSKTNRILMIFEVREVEKSIKNQSKVDQKIDSKMECLLASIF